jgi:hypothetical protein
MAKARYMKNKVTGVVWPYSPMMMGIPNKQGVVLQRNIGDKLVPGHPDMIEISEEEALAILNKGKAPQAEGLAPELAKIEEGPSIRIRKIEDAIASLDEEGWGKGPVPYPKVNDVSALTGFPVSFQEIKAIVNTMRGTDEGQAPASESIQST